MPIVSLSLDLIGVANLHRIVRVTPARLARAAGRTASGTRSDPRSSNRPRDLRPRFALTVLLNVPDHYRYTGQADEGGDSSDTPSKEEAGDSSWIGRGHLDQSRTLVRKGRVVTRRESPLLQDYKVSINIPNCGQWIVVDVHQRFFGAQAPV